MASISDERALWLGRHVLPHEPALRAWLRRRRMEGLEIDDVVQETYTRLIAAASRHHIQNPRNDAFQIANSVIVDHLRSLKVVPIASVPGLDDFDILSEAPSPERQIIDRDELRRLAEAIAAMPAKVREVFTLRRVHGLSQREVADRMGIAESTVEKHMSRGFLLMLDFFRDGGNAPPRPSSTRTDADGGRGSHARENRARD